MDNRRKNEVLPPQDECSLPSFWDRIFRKCASLFKFALSSGVSFLIDYVGYALMLQLTSGLGQSLIISNITARVVSSTVNYTINRNLVFSHKGSISKSAVQYFGLAIFILVANTFLLSVFVKNLGLPALLAKLFVEAILFVISWTVQRCFIFRKREQSKRDS